MMPSETTGDAIARAHMTNDKRRDERRDCALTGKVTASSGVSPVTSVNISPGSLAIVVNAASRLVVAEKVTVLIDSFGPLQTIVRWAAHPRYGLEFLERSNVPRAFLEYYETLSPERVLAERMDFIELDPVARARIASLKEIVDRELPNGLDKFCARVRNSPSVSNLFSSDDHMSRAKNAQRGHWGAIGAARLSQPLRPRTMDHAAGL